MDACGMIVNFLYRNLEMYGKNAMPSRRIKDTAFGTKKKPPRGSLVLTIML